MRPSKASSSIWLIIAFSLALALGASLVPPRLSRHPEGRGPPPLRDAADGMFYDTVTWPEVSAAITEIEQLLKQASSTLGGQGP